MTLFDVSETVPMPDWFSNALKEPLRVLRNNGGFDKDSSLKLITKIRKDAEGYNVGYDALSNAYADLAEAGVYDPFKVTANSFLAAMSIAQLFHSTEVAVLVEE